MAEKEAFEALGLEVRAYFDGILCPKILRVFTTFCNRHTCSILTFRLDLHRALDEIIQGRLDHSPYCYWIVKLEHMPFLHRIREYPGGKDRYSILGRFDS